MPQKDTPKFHLIVAAAGHGARFSATATDWNQTYIELRKNKNTKQKTKTARLPLKQYVKLNGKAILRHTIDNALRWPGLQSIHVIINPDDADLYHDAVSGLTLPNFIPGGKQRNESINNALNKLFHVKHKDIILIHDAVRPFTAPADVENLLETLKTARAASLAFPISDTLRRAQNQAAGEIVKRDGLWALQTPQGFRYGDLVAAHKKAKPGQNYTDDTSLVSDIGIDVKLVEGSRANIKITTMDDLQMAEALLSSQTSTRTGMGFDVHAFDKENAGSKPLILCGVKIDNAPAPLLGHSDADVGLHAITDALLGAIGEGDIGRHFPPTDDQYKDMDSAIFLQKANEMLKNKHGTIQNIDVTLICERPKISPHAEAMRTRIAEILSISPAQVNVKATTTEQLGFTGRGEGIAAQAVATVRIG